MSILSIQSAVAYGHVGNSAALLPLQRLGFEVWPINTVTLAHHPGYGAWRGRMGTAAELRALLDGLDERAAFAACQAILSGYLGEVSLGPVLVEAVERARRANPYALYCCDPVMGDAEKGFYVRAGIPEFFRDTVLPLADVLIPNLFELAFLAGRPVADVDGALDAARSLLARGPRLVVATGIRRSLRGVQRIGALAVAAKQAWHVETPLVQAPANGAGDTFAALFLGHYLRAHRVATALERAVAALHDVMAKTAETGSGELALVAAQDAFAKPKRLFKAGKIG